MSDFNRKSLNIEKKAEGYLKTYRDQMAVLENSSLIKKVRPVGMYDIYALGSILENFEFYTEMCNENGTIAHLGRIPTVALDVLTLSYATSPISVISSVQPMEEESGIVYFKNVRAATTRGNFTKGELLASSNYMPNKLPLGFASENSTVVLSTTDGTAKTFSGTLNATNLRPGTVRIVIQDVSDVILQDNGEGKLLGFNGQGTIDYATGAVQIDLLTAPAAGKAIAVTFSSNLEAQDNLTEIISDYTTKPVNAEIFALKGGMGLLQSYAMRRRFGTIAEDELAVDLVNTINSEVCNTMIQKYVTGALGTTTWSKTSPDGVSYHEHKQTIFDKIAEAESVILGNTGKGSISVIIAGRTVATTLSTLPGFSKISDGNTTGPHIYGTLNGIVIVRVPNSNVVAADQSICLYNNQSSPFESAGVYAPYMPLVVTDTIQDSNNPLVNQRAAAVWAGTEVLVPGFATKLNFSA